MDFFKDKENLVPQKYYVKNDWLIDQSQEEIQKEESFTAVNFSLNSYFKTSKQIFINSYFPNWIPSGLHI